MDKNAIISKYAGMYQKNKIKECFISILVAIFSVMLLFAPLFKSKHTINLSRQLNPSNYQSIEAFNEAAAMLKNEFNLTDEQLLKGGTIEIEKNFSLFDNVRTGVKFYVFAKNNEKIYSAASTEKQIECSLISLTAMNAVPIFSLAIFCVLIIYLPITIIYAFTCFRKASLKNVDAMCLQDYEKQLSRYNTMGNLLIYRFAYNILIYFSIFAVMLEIILYRIILCPSFISDIESYIGRGYTEIGNFPFYLYNLSGVNLIPMVIFLIIFAATADRFRDFVKRKYAYEYSLLFEYYYSHNN